MRFFDVFQALPPGLALEAALLGENFWDLNPRPPNATVDG